MCAAYWAKRRLTTARAVGAAGFDNVVNLIASSEGNQGIMLIGPPRMNKDRVVRDTVLAKFPKWADGPDPTEPIFRIRLLDTTIDDVFVQNALNEVCYRLQDEKLLEDKKRLWIHVSNLETQLTTQEHRASALELLEKLLDRPDGQPARVVVVTTSVDPIAHFQEIFTNERKGIYDDDVPEVELSRSSLLLSRFRRCYLPIAASTSQDPWWNDKQADWTKTLDWEAASYPPLTEVAAAIKSTLPKTGPETSAKTVPETAAKGVPELSPKAVADASREAGPTTPSTPPKAKPDSPTGAMLSRTFQSQALASYDLLWESCTRCEKIVLVQLAQEGFVTTQNCEVVWSLVNKGLIVERPHPTIFNTTFRQYLRHIEHDQVVERWEREDGDGLWVVAGRLIGSSLIAGGLFYLTTQDFSVDSLLPVVSGTGLFGAPVVRALLARVTMRGAGAVIPT